LERDKLIKELECCEAKFEEVIEERDRDQGLIRGNERAIKVLRRERDALLEKVETGDKLRADLARERDEVRARAGQLEGVVMGLERRVVEAQGIIEGAEGAEKRAKEEEKRAKEAEKRAKEDERRAEEARERLEVAERRAGEAMAAMEARVN
jgi:peptidoglycan hydrolase CwlO-like protein